MIFYRNDAPSLVSYSKYEGKKPRNFQSKSHFDLETIIIISSRIAKCYRIIVSSFQKLQNS